MYPYEPPVGDIQFVLHEVLGLSASGLPGHAEMTPALTAQVVGEAGRLSREVLAPLNAVGDRQGCRLEDGLVITPDGFRQAYRQICAGGWTALDCPAEHGGQGMPYALHTATGEMFVAANMAFNMYQGLTHGAISAIHSHGTAAQKATFLPRLISGEWTGTMNLTEAQAGTDLGLMRTRAEPQADGTFRIMGEKIFISAGDHDLSRNVIHLVLAKAPGGGEGTKGVSLFLVPKFMIAADGTLGARNGVSVTRIERKMGIHGNPTCVMRYDGATGWLVGDLHKGLRPMFTMMNEARLGVALQGYACAAAAHGQAAAYARERIQGRDIGGTEPVPIIAHPDIRRSLMDQRSFVEGARAFTLWGAHLIDRARAGDAAAEALISLLTPVLKGFLTDKGFEMTVAAQQVFGGHGYIEETGMSQYVRDARIAMIYEGANGVQALDLVGRKLGQDGGRAMMAFFDLANGFMRDTAGDPVLKADFLDPLAAAVRDLQAAAMYFLQRAAAAPRDALAGATDFLHLFGHVAMGYMWARMASASLGRETAFHAAKCATGRYYMARHLPATALHLRRITSGAGPVMALDAEAF